MPPLRMTPDHAKANMPEQHKQPHNDHIQEPIDSPLDFPAESPRRPIDTEARRQDGEIKRGVVVMHVRDTRHGDEGEVVQEPADDRIETRVVDVVDVRRLQLVVAALPPDQIPED